MVRKKILNKVYPAEEQGILKDRNRQNKREDIEAGELDDDIYDEEGRDVREEQDEIEPWEEGFMEGASGPGQLAKDALTGEPLMDSDDVFEAEIDGTFYRFANKENAKKFRDKLRKNKTK